MSLKIIHTSDWQIGKVFRYVDDATMGLLQDARLKVITSLGESAEKHGAGHILVAGDVYDIETPSQRSLNQPLERMRNFPGVRWHLLPGNHDPHRPNGLWDRILARELPENIHIHTTPEPVIFEEESLVLLPAPLLHRHTLDNATAYMEDLDLPEGLIRVGIAHGTITGFGSGDDSTPNYIPPDLPERAGLSYLALGDWHGKRKINDRCWYSGTPETDSFKVSDGGYALLVEINDWNSLPEITALETGHYKWLSFSERINSAEDIDFLEEKLRAIQGNLENTLVHLEIEGALSLEDRNYLEERITEGVSAALCFLRTDTEHLFPHPTERDLDQIDQQGFVRAAADTLKTKADEGDQLSAEALQRLYIEHMKFAAEKR